MSLNFATYATPALTRRTLGVTSKRGVARQPIASRRRMTAASSSCILNPPIVRVIQGMKLRCCTLLCVAHTADEFIGPYVQLRRTPPHTSSDLLSLSLERFQIAVPRGFERGPYLRIQGSVCARQDSGLGVSAQVHNGAVPNHRSIWH
jgi:hypothetical protein